MGTGLYPQFVSGLMCQVGVSKFVDCCCLAGWWTPIFFVFCFVRLPIVDGTGCLVWWSVKFVFRIVDGTGMFSVLFVSHVLNHVSLYVDVLGWDGTCG